MKSVYLRSRREQLGLTQEALEQSSGIAQNTISKLESQPHARPAFSTVMALAAALGVDPTQLRFGPDPRRPIRRRKRVAA
jgi:transcriptional regulator with XRE-family HTH domain